MSKTTLLAALVLSAASGCGEFEVENESPVARAQVLVNGAPIAASGLIPFTGEPVTVTLDGTMSSDEDGSIAQYIWVRTGVGPSANFPGFGADGGTPDMVPRFANPLPGSPSIQVSLGEGEYQYSLWVRDNEGRTSEPATVEFQLGRPYMPDPMCAMTYQNPNMDCQSCVCTPNDMGGCLNEFNDCTTHSDPMFVELCLAVVRCAVEAGCTGSACYTGGCMAQIDAAATYMGGTLANCSDMSPTAPMTNPCAAASRLGACSSMGACMSACAR